MTLISLIQEWSRGTEIDVWGSPRDLLYLQDVVYTSFHQRPRLIPLHSGALLDGIEPSGLLIVQRQTKLQMRLIYRCEEHSDCRESIALGRACHMEPASIRTWVVAQRSPVSVSEEDLPHLE